ncbi:MAG: hypothetical protein Q9166_006305 [cf. Caloplaca sp. 2 TL-2023]
MRKLIFVHAKGKTPLVQAFAEGADIVKTLLAHGANVAFGSSPPIGHAVSSLSVEAVEVLIEAGANCNVLYDETTRPPEPVPLHIAKAKIYSRGSDEDMMKTAKQIVKLLIATGACRRATQCSGQNGHDPLHYAIKKGRYMSPPVIRRLLDAGADPSIPYPDTTTSMLHIILPCMAEGGQTFMGPPSLFSPLVQRFVDAGVDKEARDSDGNSPIFGYVAKQTSYDDEYDDMDRYPNLDEQRQVLLGYNIHAKNNAGEGPLHVVAKRSRHAGYEGGRDDTREMFKLLWELVLDPEEEDGNQRTPLDVAAACGNMGILDLFAPKRRG